MNKKGFFRLFIFLVFAFVVVFAFLLIAPEVLTPNITATIAETAGSPHGADIEFFLRILPWGIPLILIGGFLWWMFSGR